MNVCSDDGVDPLGAPSSEFVNDALWQRALSCLRILEQRRLELILAETHPRRAGVQAHADLLKPQAMQVVLAGLNNMKLLRGEDFTTGDTRCQTGSCREVPHLVPPGAQHLALLCLAPACFHEGGFRAKFSHGARAGAVVSGVVGIAALQDHVRSKLMRGIHDALESQALAVIAAICWVLRHGGIRKRIDRDADHMGP